MSDDLNNSYDLIFEGMADESPDALRKIKATLIADLEMSIEDVQATLSNSKPVVRSAQTEAELQSFYKLIKSAGGKVLIVHRGKTSSPATPQTASPTMSISESGAFTFDFTEEVSASASKASSENDLSPRVHEIAESDDIESILSDPQFNEIAESSLTPPSPAEAPESLDEAPVEDAPQEPASPLGDLSLSDETAPIIPPSLTLGNKTVISASPPKPAVPALDDAPLFDLAPATDEDIPDAESPPTQKSVAPPHAEISLSLDGDDETKAAPPKNEIPPEAAQALRDVARLQEQLEQSINEISTPPGQEVDSDTESLSLSLKEDIQKEKGSAKALTPKPSAMPTEGLAMDLDESTPPPPQELKTPVKSPSAPKAKEEIETTVRPTPQPLPLAKTAEGVSVDSPQILAAKSTSIRRRMKHLHLDLVIPIVVGALLLGVANYFYFSSPAPESGMSALEQAAIKSVKEETAKEAARVPAPPKAEAFVGSATSETALFRATIAMLDSGRIANYTIEGSTPQPPPLTPEQIVNGVVGSPWIRKFEIGELPMQHSDDGSFTIRGTSRAFVEYKDQRLRIPVQTVIDGKTSSDRSEITLTIQLLSGISEAPSTLPDPGSTIEAQPNGRFSIAARASMRLLRPTTASPSTSKK